MTKAKKIDAGDKAVEADVKPAAEAVSEPKPVEAKEKVAEPKPSEPELTQPETAPTETTTFGG